MTDQTGAGGCLCGAVRYQLAEIPTKFGACHCGMCRKFTGGIDLGTEVPQGGLDWQQGEDHIKTYKSSDWAERGFCGTCGSSLFWRLTMEGPAKGLTILNTGTLDTMDGLEFANEVYVDHKPDAYDFAGERTRMTEAEVMEMVNAGGPD